MTVRIKICGITGKADALEAHRLGADYIGIIVDIASSHRSVSTDMAADICAAVPRAVLLMEGPVTSIKATLRQINPHAVQLIGSYTNEDIAILKKETGSEIWKTVPIPRKDAAGNSDLDRYIDEIHRAPIDTLVLDTMVPGLKGGTGKTCDWATAARVVSGTEQPVFLAGGLNPENVARSIAEVRPFGVDVSSGVESTPGKKDMQKISEFIYQAHNA